MPREKKRRKDEEEVTAGRSGSARYLIRIERWSHDSFDIVSIIRRQESLVES